MNDRASFIDNSGDAAAQHFDEANKAWERDRLKEQLMDSLHTGGVPQERVWGRPFPNFAMPVDHFAEWLPDQRFFVRDILCPGERTVAEVLDLYRREWIDEIVRDDGTDTVRERYNLEP